jgi:hypothetical protein
VVRRSKSARGTAFFAAATVCRVLARMRSSWVDILFIEYTGRQYCSVRVSISAVRCKAVPNIGELRVRSQARRQFRSRVVPGRDFLICARRRLCTMRLPCRNTLFPLIVSQLLYVSSVAVHHKDFAVWLRRPSVLRFVFESHSRTGE